MLNNSGFKIYIIVLPIVCCFLSLGACKRQNLTQKPIRTISWQFSTNPQLQIKENVELFAKQNNFGLTILTPNNHNNQYVITLSSKNGIDVLCSIDPKDTGGSLNSKSTKMADVYTCYFYSSFSNPPSKTEVIKTSNLFNQKILEISGARKVKDEFPRPVEKILPDWR